MGLQAYAGSGWNIHSQTFEFCRGNSLAKNHQFAPLQWWKSLSVPKIIKDIVTCYSLRTGCMLILTDSLPPWRLLTLFYSTHCPSSTR